MKEHIEILLEELGEAKCQLFDIREIKEWQNSRLKQATLQPLSFLKKGLLYQEANKEKKQKVKHFLKKLELPEETYSRYPFQLSGGQRQRIMLAIAYSKVTEIL